MQGLILFIALAISQLSDPHKSFASNSPLLMTDFIAAEATLDGVDPSVALHIAKAESSMNSDAVGDHGTSFGLFQIHLPAHPDISEEEAENPVFSTEWAMIQLKEGNCDIWSTCPTNPDNGG